MIDPKSTVSQPQARIAAVSFAAIAVLVAASLTFQHCHGASQLSPAVHDSVMALAASRTIDSAAHAQHIVAAETALVASTRASATSRHAETSAALAAARADSAAALARAATTARDSAAHWRVAYENERTRGDSLQAALLDERKATDDARMGARENWIADSVSAFRLARVEALNKSLVSEAERLSAGCRILPGISCPSRTQAIIVTAIATYVVVRHPPTLPHVP